MDKHSVNAIVVVQVASSYIRVEPPIPNHDPIMNL